ncbi:MAG: hypothetical protein AAF371_09070 [Pseudomonadota bacterium]
MNLPPELRAAVEVVERACAHAQPPQHLHNRLDFLRAEEEERLLGRDRAALGPEDIFVWIDEAPNEMPVAEVAWFLPRHIALIAEGEHCAGVLNWPYALTALKRSGFPERWPEDAVDAVIGFAAALMRDYARDPGRLGPVLDSELPRGFEALLAFAVGGNLPLGPVLAGLDDVAPPQRARLIARWSVESVGPERTAYGGIGFEAMADFLVASAFLHPEAACVTKSWLVLQEPWVIIPRALEGETEPEWQDVLDEAATLWMAAARDGREGRAVSPWRSRSRYLRRYRQKRRRRSGPAPTTG